MAAGPAPAQLVARFHQDIAARWDLAALDAEVRLSQRRRRAVTRALGAGVQAPWDFSPPYDGARRYIRNHMDLGTLEDMARFPPVRPSEVTRKVLGSEPEHPGLIEDLEHGHYFGQG